MTETAATLVSVKAYFESRHGETVYPSDVANHFDIPWAEANALCQELDARGQIRQEQTAALITDEEVDVLAQKLREAYVMTMIGRQSISFTMTPWDKLVARERAPYLAQAVAAFRHFTVCYQ